MILIILLFFFTMFRLPFGPQSFSTICGSLVNEYLQGTPVDTLKSRFATLSNVEVLLNDALDFWALVSLSCVAL